MVQPLHVRPVGAKELWPTSRRGRLVVRKTYKHLVLFALLSGFALLGMTASQTDPGLAQAAAKPNIVFILTDDMRASDLDKVVNGQYVMPNTRELLVKQGVNFTKPWVTRSLCCPSRAT